MKNQHTATPWEVYSDYPRDIRGPYHNQPPSLIVTAYCEDLKDDETEAIANASLIVCAVNTHEELLQFAKNVEAYLAGLGTSRDDAECALLNYAEQIIQKVKKYEIK